MRASFIHPDWQERAAAWHRKDEQDQLERQLRKFFRPEFIESNRKEAERQFKLFRPEYVEKVLRREEEPEAALHAKFDAALEKYLAGDPHSEEFSPEEEAKFNEYLDRFRAEQGPSVAEAVELLAEALQREEAHL